MRYTPLDVRHQEFPGGMGGYKRLDVRTFLNELADELETLLLNRQELNEQLMSLNGRMAEYRQSEDDLRRAVVGAERIAQELRENARREAELITQQAEAHREGVVQLAEARSVALEARHEARTGELDSLHRSRSTELEAAHQARSTQLEASYRARFSDLEAQYHRRHRELEQGLGARTAHMEAVFSQRHNELSTLLSRAQGEQAQFMAQYRALVGSFHELAARHPLPDSSPLPTELPPQALAAPAQLPPAPAPTPPQPVLEAGAVGSEPGAATTPSAADRVEEQQFV